MQILLFKNLAFCPCSNRLVRVCPYSLLEIELFEEQKFVVVLLVVLCNLILITFICICAYVYLYVCEVHIPWSMHGGHTMTCRPGLKSGYHCGYHCYSWSHSASHSLVYLTVISFKTIILQMFFSFRLLILAVATIRKE